MKVATISKKLYERKIEKIQPTSNNRGKLLIVKKGERKDTKKVTVDCGWEDS